MFAIEFEFTKSYWKINNGFLYMFYLFVYFEWLSFLVKNHTLYPFILFILVVFTLYLPQRCSLLV